MKARHRISTLSLLLLLHPTPAGAGEPVLDQCTVNPGDPIAVAAGIGLFEFAQTFTAGSSGTLSSIHLWIRRHREDTDLLVEVLPTVSGIPVDGTNPPLASVVLPARSVPPSALSDDLTPVDLTRFRIPVVQGEILAIALRTTAEPPFGLGFSWDGGRDGYAGGGVYSRSRGDPAGFLACCPESDLGLKTFVEPWMTCPDRPTLIAQDAPVAEPAHHTEALFSGAMGRVVVPARPGTRGTKRLYGALVSDLEGERELQGWNILAATLGDIAITEMTTDGTASAPWPEGYFRDGFNRTRLLSDSRHACASSAGNSAIVLSVTMPVSLPPRGTATVLSLLVEALSPQGPEPVVGTLDWPSDCCKWLCAGAGGCGQPCSSSVTVSGEGANFCEVRGAEVRFIAAPSRDFRRGDSNGDAGVDLSDAIRTIMFLFLGAAEPPCLDAADAGDDGSIDLSDAILLLNDFFRPGTGISAPGPFACGPDPTLDLLDCAASSFCE